MTDFSKGEGRLWPNDHKQKEFHPDMRGYIEINGLQYEFAAWERTPRGGGKDYLYVKIGDLKERQPERQLPRHGD